MQFQQRFWGSLLVAVVVCIAGAGAAKAQTPITDNDGIRAFELYQNGLFWWDGGGVCDGEFPHDTTIRVRNTLAASTKQLVRDCEASKRIADNPVRDDLYVYFFQEGQLSRKALNATEADAAQPLANAPALPTGQTGSNLALAEGNLYWTVAGSGATVNIVRMPVDGSQAPTTVISSVRPILKLAWRRYSDSNNQSQVALVWITDDSRLFRYRIGAAGAAQQLASTVADFAMQTHFLLNGSITSIYAAVGTTGVVPGINPGKLLQINIDTGTQITVYNATGNDQVLAVGRVEKWWSWRKTSERHYTASATSLYRASVARTRCGGRHPPMARLSGTQSNAPTPSFLRSSRSAHLYSRQNWQWSYRRSGDAGSENNGATDEKVF